MAYSLGNAATGLMKSYDAVVFEGLDIQSIKE